MATIKAIEACSVHQIQSGQVIVDLCSVVKELVENSLDAGATNIEVSFRNNGLDLIEVRDNGAGISPSNYASVALKHYTSKLSNYDDLSTLETFGFRGEALSSLCALSSFSITTAQADQVPKGTRLEFGVSGALKSSSTVASQKGTAASVENLFENLPVRRKELTKNIKREYGKVLSLLHAYACIGTDVRFSVKNTMPKAKSMVAFSTRGNPTTRDNIANVYGAKTLGALVSLDLELDYKQTLTQTSRDDGHTTKVNVRGHISRPIFGEGRQTPDRQMFFVNGRPCGLPQIAKAVNEVYKSFNASQSPFILADFRMDTNAYDVNVSPDKRTILLHNAATLIERLKASLADMFDKHEQTVPQSQLHGSKLPAFKQLSVQMQGSTGTASSNDFHIEPKAPQTSKLRDEGEQLDDDVEEGPNRLLQIHFRNQASTREDKDHGAQVKSEARLQRVNQKQAEKIAQAVARDDALRQGLDEYDDLGPLQQEALEEQDNPISPHAIRVRDFNARITERQRPGVMTSDVQLSEAPVASMAPVIEKDRLGVVQNAFYHMRPKKMPAQIATITIDDETTMQVIGTQLSIFGKEAGVRAALGQHLVLEKENISKFSQSLRKFGAPSTQDSNREFRSASGEDGTAEAQMERRTESVESLVDEEEKEDDEEKTDEDKTQTMLTETSGSTGAVDYSSNEDEESDNEYIDEAEKKAEEEARVAELIRAAEESASMPSKENVRRANRALKGGQMRDPTTNLLTTLDISLDSLRQELQPRRSAATENSGPIKDDSDLLSAQDPESRLSLTVSKDEFAQMEITGQFNLGFILALRRASRSTSQATTGHDRDELFIIDQHASDEIFNFERLQAETVVGNQRMVQPVNLNLTAVEEEIVLENIGALEKNGFIVEFDASGASSVGRRVTLLSLPLSKDVTFDTRDLDELIHLLSETPVLGPDSPVPRPGRVRKMFAMRACRSSVMIGKTLSKKQMERIVGNMGTMEKPWNCPHGRPTMRHLSSLNGLGSWDEGEMGGEDHFENRAKGAVWRDYLAG